MDDRILNIFGISLTIIIILVLMVITQPDETYSSRKTCYALGCRNEALFGNYCSVHKSTSLKSSNNKKSSEASSYGNKSYYSNKKSSGNNRTVYNSLDYDPVDYDDPEEYADDAVGHDFDDWDEAYDYWEDY